MLDYLGSPVEASFPDDESGLVELTCRNQRDLQMVCNSFCPDCIAGGTGPNPPTCREVYCSTFIDVGDPDHQPAFDISQARKDGKSPDQIMSCWRLLAESAQRLLLLSFFRGP